MGDTDWETLKRLAEDSESTGDYEAAESLWFAALQTVEFKGEEDPRLATNLEKLAFICFCLRKYAQAENLYWEALDMKERYSGPDDISLGSALKGLAAVFYEQGKFEEAEVAGRRVLELYEFRLGPTHPEVGEILMNMAVLCHNRKDTAQAEELYLRALEIREQSGGDVQQRILSPFSSKQAKPASVCNVCGRTYSGTECLKCTQTKLTPLPKNSKSNH